MRSRSSGVEADARGVVGEKEREASGSAMQRRKYEKVVTMKKRCTRKGQRQGQKNIKRRGMNEKKRIIDPFLNFGALFIPSTQIFVPTM